VPLTETFFTVGFLAIQVGLIVVFWSRSVFKFVQNSGFRKIVCFVVIEALCMAGILFGGYLEEHYTLYSMLREPVDEYRQNFPEAPSVNGDPSLVQWVEKQKPSLPRPAFDSVSGFVSWQSSLRHTLQGLFDVSDMHIPVYVRYKEIASTKIDNEITRIFIVFESFDGTTIPAYLFLPTSNGKLPGIIVVPGHVGRYESGIGETAGITKSYQHEAALRLCKAGFAVITFELRGFGYLGGKVDTEHKLVAHNAILGGSFYKAIVSKDMKYAIDLLRLLPEVDPDRIGITGVSFGGEMAVTYAALDERVKVVVCQGFGGSIGATEGVRGKKTVQPHYCHVIPGQNKLFFQEDIYLLVAPRPLLGIRGDHEYRGDLESFSNTVGRAYKTLSAASSFAFTVAPGGHEYFIQPAVGFFKKFL
jgi:dienelactone hydrolase